MFVVDLLLLALSAMVFPDPGMQGVFIHPEVTGGLGNGLIRIDCQFHRTFLACGGGFFHRSLAHRTHLVCCVSSLSPCVRESIATSHLHQSPRDDVGEWIMLKSLQQGNMWETIKQQRDR